MDPIRFLEASPGEVVVLAQVIKKARELRLRHLQWAFRQQAVHFVNAWGEALKK